MFIDQNSVHRFQLNIVYHIYLIITNLTIASNPHIFESFPSILFHISQKLIPLVKFVKCLLSLRKEGVLMNNEQKQLLNNLLNHDILLDTDTLELLKIMKRNKVLKVHMSKITSPKSDAHRWQTYVKRDEETSKKVNSVSEEGLMDKLYDFYFVNIVPTATEFYDQWIENRKSENMTYKTICRYHNYWDKYYAFDPIVEKKLNNISSHDIEEFYHKQIRTHKITLKELGNMKVILKDMLKYAKKMDIITYNPFLEAEILTFACRPPIKYKDESRIYSNTEKEAMFEGLNEEISNFDGCTDMHGIFLLFSKGLRIAELAAIKLADIDFEGKQLYIHRMQTVLEDDNNKAYVTVVNYGKKMSPYAIRWLDLTDFEIDMIRDVIAINKKYGYGDQDFLFLDNEGRTNIREFDNRIRKLCRKIGMEEKSAHDIRRTVASQLYLDGLSLEQIKDYLGHSDIKTTQSYIYDINSKKQKRQLLKKSLSNMNGLKRTKTF